MQISIDGASRRNGQITCVSVGVAYIVEEDGNCTYKATTETCSTNQRGEINGLLGALRYANAHSSPDEDIIIITDSEYIYNTISKDWIHKWADNEWIGSQGSTVKNYDMWAEAIVLLDSINKDHERVFMQWIKGHLITYTLANTKRAMQEDNTGVELFARVFAVAHRAADKERIIKDVIYQLKKHDKIVPPDDVCLSWAISNTMADCIASYIATIYDDVTL